MQQVRFEHTAPCHLMPGKQARCLHTRERLMPACRHRHHARIQLQGGAGHSAASSRQIELQLGGRHPYDAPITRHVS